MQEGFGSYTDVYLGEDGTIWSGLAEEPCETSTLMKSQNIHINFLSEINGSLTLGGVDGLWSQFGERLISFEQETKIPGFYSWKGAKDFKDYNLQWFSVTFCTNFYFNAKGNAYRITNKEPFYELVWENSQILQFNAGPPDVDHFQACLLDNGQVWVIDNSKYYIFSKLPTNNAGWTHLSFYDDKNVKYLAMSETIFILCENPKSKLYYHSPHQRDERDDDENYDKSLPIEHTLMSSKTIIKLVNPKISGAVIVWCEEGIYTWYIDEGLFPQDRYLIHGRVYNYAPCLDFFQDKKILDVGALLYFYILCDDGVYVISDTSESEIWEAISSVIQYSPTPIKLPSRFENFINIFPSYFSAFRKLGKSARSTTKNPL